CMVVGCGQDAFFFSSRRRHTRFSRDWSSDVCSSDLVVMANLPMAVSGVSRNATPVTAIGRLAITTVLASILPIAPNRWSSVRLKIGRASCRERVSVAMVAGAANEEKTDAQLAIGTEL